MGVGGVGVRCPGQRTDTDREKPGEGWGGSGSESMSLVEIQFRTKFPHIEYMQAETLNVCPWHS